MIYRGFTYTPAPLTAAKGSVPLMYRGVAHMSRPEDTKMNRTKALIYRGVSYMKSAYGHIVPDSSPATIGGLTVPV